MQFKHVFSKINEVLFLHNEMHRRLSAPKRRVRKFYNTLSFKYENVLPIQILCMCLHAYLYASAGRMLREKSLTCYSYELFHTSHRKLVEIILWLMKPESLTPVNKNNYLYSDLIYSNSSY